MPLLPHRALILSVLLGVVACALSSCATPRPLPEPNPPDPLPRLEEPKSTHPLATPRTFTKTLLYIKDNYAFPGRIKPKQMLLASLESVEKAVQDVTVDGSADAGQVKVTVGNQTRVFDISYVNSVWKMSYAIRHVFAFIGENLRPEVDPREVEYAATNGMLSTLDPHSVLFPPNAYSELKKASKQESGGIGASGPLQQRLLSQGVGYVRLKSFQDRAAKELEAALEELGRKSGPEGLKGLVLDLRGNRGGLLEQAIQAADLFLSTGTIVVVTGLGGRLREEARARPGGHGERPWPIAVLVDAHSAAASEIVAGALTVQNRAVVIGQQTSGMGSVQVLYDFPDGSALKLTIARYLAPGDLSIEGVGITPDIELVPAPGTRELDAESLERIEEDLEVRFARDFLLKQPSAERGLMLHRGPGDGLSRP